MKTGIVLCLCLKPVLCCVCVQDRYRVVFMTKTGIVLGLCIFMSMSLYEYEYASMSSS